MLIIYTVGAQFNDTAGNANTIIKPQNFDPVANESKQLVQIRNVDQTQVEKLRKDDAFWYVNTTPVREEAKQPTESFSNKLARKQWFRNLMWSLIIGSFIAVLVWFLVSSNVKLFRKKAVIVDKSKNEDVTSENIFSINYDEEMHKAISTANYRSAIRLMYLQLLKNLSERQIIHYKQEKTNNDYVMQLYNTRYYKTFFQLTRNFEYAWYGQFQIKQEAFKIIESEFASFKQTLP
ncbi:MAG TPA: hypothetical protein VNA26_08945 [Chitinophagaceae bacterium]|nr:hypothetical protein [Chitinophagaceae bacterium]